MISTVRTKANYTNIRHKPCILAIKNRPVMIQYIRDWYKKDIDDAINMNVHANSRSRVKTSHNYGL